MAVATESAIVRFIIGRTRIVIGVSEDVLIILYRFIQLRPFTFRLTVAICWLWCGRWICLVLQKRSGDSASAGQTLPTITGPCGKTPSYRCESHAVLDSALWINWERYSVFVLVVLTSLVSVVGRNGVYLTDRAVEWNRRVSRRRSKDHVSSTLQQPYVPSRHGHDGISACLALRW